MKLWLDDLRDPTHYGYPDWTWVKTAEDAIAAFKTGQVERASLDHDLTVEQMNSQIYGMPLADGQKSGYDVVLWLERNPQYWPPFGCAIHSSNPAGRARMKQVTDRHYNKPFCQGDVPSREAALRAEGWDAASRLLRLLGFDTAANLLDEKLP